MWAQNWRRGASGLGMFLVKDYTNWNLSEEYAFGYQYFSTGLYLKFYFSQLFLFWCGMSHVMVP